MLLWSGKKNAGGGPCPGCDDKFDHFWPAFGLLRSDRLRRRSRRRAEENSQARFQIQEKMSKSCLFRIFASRVIARNASAHFEGSKMDE
jgi:hypothetical protein